MSTKLLFSFMVIFAFAGVISFFQINSSWADKHHFNGLFGWVGVGIVFCIIAVYFLYRVVKQSGTGKEER